MIRIERLSDFLAQARALAFVAGLFVAAFAGQAWAQSGLPVSELIETSILENGTPVKLELLVAKPTGSGPFPVVLLNHGSTGRGNNPELFRQSWTPANLTKYFVEKGWLVIAPQRRGRGSSDGLYDEGFTANRSGYACDPNLSLPGVDRAIADLDAVMAHVRTRADVRSDRFLVAGQSRGGILSVAYAGERAQSFIGVINFVGGWMGEACSQSALINQSTFARGAKFAKPTLWLYGETDPFYSIAHSRANFDAFTRAGGKGEFVSYWVPGQNAGHGLISHPALWQAKVEAYLAQIAP